MTDPIKTGDRLLIAYKGRELEGVCLLASPNGRSLVLAFDGLLDGYLGTMPVLLEKDGVFRDLIEGQPVELRKP